MHFLSVNDVSRESSLLNEELINAFKSALQKSHFILGEEVAIFEEEFAKYCGTKFALGVGNGTSALYLSLLALGIGKRDEVITTAMSFAATASAIVQTGAKPVFVDIKKETGSIDVNSIEKKINERTKAILPVHLYGVPAELNAIKVLCNKYNLFLIEDCAQAHGAEYQGKKVGSFGNAGCFSFMPSKNLGACGDAGAIIVNDNAVYEKLSMLHNHGRKERYVHEYIGFTERLDTIQAAILSIKLKYLELRNGRRREIAEQYDKRFKEAGITVLQIPQNVKPVYYVYPIFVSNRDEISDDLKKNNIESIIHYPLPLHLQPCFSYLGYKRGDLPVAEEISNKVLSIPMHPFLSDEEVDYVANSVINCIKKYG